MSRECKRKHDDVHFPLQGRGKRATPRKLPTADARIAHMQQVCKDFNEKFPPGTPVTLHKDSGFVDTVVTDPAFMVSGVVAVAFFEGINGYYAIDGRVSARKVEP